ncbi:MAG: hypothetical protein ABII90_00755 [Bacteroidota bacterium]
MKKLITAILIGLIFNINAFDGNAQVVDIEKTYEITGKAKRGALAKVDYDGLNGLYILYYVTKSREKYMKFQIYTFDKDFNFVNMEEDEIEFEKVKTKYKWFDFNGELYSVQGNYVEPNLIGTLVLKEKKITYKYDWLFLGYHKNVEILKKVKPKTDDGRKFYYYAHAEDDETGFIYVLCGIKANLKSVKGGGDPYSQNRDMVVLKFNPELEIVKEVSIKFDYPQNLAFNRAYSEYDENFNVTNEVGGMIFVTSPMGGPGMNKVADPENANYTFVNVDSECNLVSQIPFKSYASFWKIDELVLDVTNNDMYLFGPSAAGKDKYYNLAMATTKFKAVQLLKISNNKLEYITETDLEEFEAKFQKPPSQKKAPAYKGKKFEIANYKLAGNGDLFVIGQNFTPNQEKGNQYKDVLAFHFDNKGTLKAQYGVDIKESNKYAKAAGAPQEFIENSDGSGMFWLLMEFKGLTMWGGKPLTYPRIGKIDLANGTISDFSDYGVDGDYYLDPKFPYLETDKGHRIVFFGSNKSGKVIWFLRVNIE